VQEEVGIAPFNIKLYAQQEFPLPSLVRLTVMLKENVNAILHLPLETRISSHRKLEKDGDGSTKAHSLSNSSLLTPSMQELEVTTSPKDG
jgi:hypothetical protein